MQAIRPGRYKAVRFSYALWQLARARNLSLSLRGPGLHGAATPVREWREGDDIVIVYAGKGTRWPIIRAGQEIPCVRALVAGAAPSSSHST